MYFWQLDVDEMTHFESFSFIPHSSVTHTPVSFDALSQTLKKNLKIISKDLAIYTFFGQYRAIILIPYRFTRISDIF